MQPCHNDSSVITGPEVPLNSNWSSTEKLHPMPFVVYTVATATIYQVFIF